MQRGHVEEGWAWLTPAPGYLPLLADICGSLPGPFVPLPILEPWTGRLFRAGLDMVMPALWAAILRGPSHGKVTLGEGVSTLWAVAVRTHGLADSAPHSLKRMFAGAGYTLCQHLITL